MENGLKEGRLLQASGMSGSAGAMVGARSGWTEIAGGRVIVLL